MSTKSIIASIIAVVILIAGLVVGIPYYRVWSQEMEGRAEFAKAEQNRKIKIEESRSALEAAKLDAQAEIERAKGAS